MDRSVTKLTSNCLLFYFVKNIVLQIGKIYYHNKYELCQRNKEVKHQNQYKYFYFTIKHIKKLQMSYWVKQN